MCLSYLSRDSWQNAVDEALDHTTVTLSDNVVDINVTVVRTKGDVEVYIGMDDIPDEDDHDFEIKGDWLVIEVAMYPFRW